MSFGIGISFPKNPTKEDVKKLKQQVAKGTFKVVDGGQKRKPKN